MRIGIDGQLLTGNITGMGVVLHNILLRLSINKNDKVFLYVMEALPHNLANVLEVKGFIIKTLRKSNYIVWEQIILTRQSKADNLDVFWFPYNTGSLFLSCSMVITIHDLIFMYGSPLSPPTFCKKLGKIYRRWNVPLAVRRARHIITISKSAQKEIEKLFPETTYKLSVVYWGTGIGGGNFPLVYNHFLWKYFPDAAGLPEVANILAGRAKANCNC